MCIRDRIVTEFAPQPGNPSVDRSIEPVKADAAQFLQQIVARQDVPGVASEQPEQIEFRRGQVDAVAAEMAAASRLTDAEPAKSQFGRFRCVRTFSGKAATEAWRAAQQSLCLLYTSRCV